jgi:hypothetical protein
MTWFHDQPAVGRPVGLKVGEQHRPQSVSGKIRVAAKQAKIEEANKKMRTLIEPVAKRKRMKGTPVKASDAAESQLKIEETQQTRDFYS